MSDIKDPVDIKEPAENVQMPDIEVTKATTVTKTDNAGKVSIDEKRETFTVNAEAVKASLLMALGDVDLTADSLKKVYPNSETSIDDALPAMLIGALTLPQRTQFNTPKGTLDNVIRYTDLEGAERKTGISKNKPKLNGSRLVGDDALLSITSVLGLREQVQLPLVNSGFRIKIAGPSGEDLALLDEQLLRNKGEMGRLTLGSSHALPQVYITRDVCNLALRLIKGTNVEGNEGPSIETLRGLIKEPDYQSLVLAMLAANHLDGGNLDVPCTSVVETCKEITNGKVNFSRMLYVDQDKLSDPQLEQITRSMSDTVTLKEVSDYQESFKIDCNIVEVPFGKRKLKVFFKIPTLDEHITQGSKWAGSINVAINNFLRGREDNVVRKRMLNRTIALNVLTQYISWFDKIEVWDGKDMLTYVDEPDTMTTILRELISDDAASTIIFDAVNKFIEVPDPVTVGVPQFACPSCSTTIAPKERYIVPVDVQMLFFILSCDQMIFQSHIDNMAMLQ